MRTVTLWAVAGAVGLAVGRPQETAVGPSNSDPVLEAARRSALRYSQTLPDFVCAEFIHRYQNWTGTDFQFDTITFRVSFYRQREAYELVARNQKPSTQRVESLNGSITRGEFGSALRRVFDAESAAVFEPQRPKRIERRAVATYAYAVRLENSHYELEYGSHGILSAYHGSVHIDPSTSRVLRLTTEVDPPPDFPIRQVATTIDYNFRAIGEEQYPAAGTCRGAHVRAAERRGAQASQQKRRGHRPPGRPLPQYRGVSKLPQVLNRFEADVSLTGPWLDVGRIVMPGLAWLGN